MVKQGEFDFQSVKGSTALVGASSTAAKHWSSRLAFVIATVGFAVGLGNLWRFPYLAGENGGAAFIVLYLLAVFLIGLPLVIAELMIGRDGGPDVPTAWAKLARSEGASPAWRGVGYLGVFASLAIASFYCVIGGWTLAFAWDALRHLFAGGGGLNFESLLASPGQIIVWQAVFLLANLVIVSGGLHRGLERAVCLMMPMLVIMMLGLLALSMRTGAFGQAVDFLFAFDPSLVTPGVAVEAVGQAFFSVGVGLSVLVTYGGYLKGDAKLGRLGVLIVMADTGIALLAGLMIFPFVFAVGLEPTEGPTLLFVTMQAAFAQMGGGAWLAALFFTLVAVAALTSTVALFEMVAALGEARSISRSKTLGWTGAILWLSGFGTVLSFNIASDFHPLGFIPLFENATIFGVIDILTSRFALPLGGLFVSTFAGWAVSRDRWAATLGLERASALLSTWVLLLRFAIPATLLLTALKGVAG